MITGASSGLGLAASIAAAHSGAEVVMVSRRAEELGRLAAALPGSGHVAAPFDLGRIEDIGAWMPQFGPLDGLAHFAGVQAVAPLRALSLKKTEAMFLVNVTAALALSKAFCSRNVARRPASIVLVSSVMGLVGSPARSAYSASKAALIGMARSLAVELAPAGITVNCLAPGFVKTAMWEEMESMMGNDQRQQIIGSHPLGLGEPEDVASAAVYLLSPAARWITGTALVIDGGYSAQ